MYSFFVIDMYMYDCVSVWLCIFHGAHVASEQLLRVDSFLAPCFEAGSFCFRPTVGSKLAAR